MKFLLYAYANGFILSFFDFLVIIGKGIIGVNLRNIVLFYRLLHFCHADEGSILAKKKEILRSSG